MASGAGPVATEPVPTGSGVTEETVPPAGVAPVRQLSLFGVEATEPSPADLTGLLVGPGQVVRMGGTARVSVVVDSAWRVHVLAAELATRGLPVSWEGTGDQRHEVRTAYATTLAPLARSWLRGGAKRPPAGLYLNGRRLRLWVAAAGSPEPAGFLLRLGDAEENCWEPVGAALAAVGLPAVLLPPRAAGPAYRITGRRRLARLMELVGERPAAAPAASWPTSAG
ncbi:hypothetical protein BDK92_4144 [Micromonospora pisi]|uniref:Uncharacterized protein n=1 Tax=Micromonospora pisi TaxID=589240 RepID=A0A495JLD7_9ACTN|nr:hypothetical protein BDK92_4144 [Micromonospora pisi]